MSRVLTDTHPALPGSVVLRLRSENGATDRANPEYGNVTINHSPTKELGGGYRHVVRNNLRAQGDIRPASAHIVAVGHDSLEGEQRCFEAIIGLITIIATLDDAISISTVDANGIPTEFTRKGDPDTLLDWTALVASSSFADGLRRLVGRES